MCCDFTFIQCSRNFLISFLVSPLTKLYPTVSFLVSHESVYFLSFLFLLICSFIPLWSDHIQDTISILINLFRLLCVLMFGQFWRKFHRLQRRKYILYCSNEMGYSWLLGQFDLWCHLASEFLYLVFDWMTSLLIRVKYWSHPALPCWVRLSVACFSTKLKGIFLDCYLCILCRLWTTLRFKTFLWSTFWPMQTL